MPHHPPPTAEVSPRPPEEQFQSQQQVPQEVIPAPTPGNAVSLGPAPCSGPILRQVSLALYRPLPVTPACLPTPELPAAGDLETEPTEPGPLGKNPPGSWRKLPWLQKGEALMMGFAVLSNSGMLGDRVLWQT